ASPTAEGAAAAAPNPGEAKERILRWVAELGLSQAGVAPPEPPLRSGFLLEWLRRGYHASLHYLARDPALRTDPRRLLDGCASVICVALDYPSGRDPGECDPSIARIARYAWGDDYHDLLKAKLRDLAARIEAAWPGTRTRVAVDTSPVLERAFAARAGLGWPGKHTNLISPERGSYFFLGELFTTLALPPDEPVADHCGTCRRCLEVCPTGAFPEPYVLDARRCISYLTIEHRGPIDPGYHAGIGNWIFGCDLCQEVCPWNREAPGGPAGDLLFRPREGNLGRPVEEWESLDVDGYRERFRRSAVKRARFDGMVRNIAIAAANAADARRATGASATEALARAGPTREASMSAGREVELYGAAWSPESRVARRFLEQHGVAYRWIEVEGDVKARVQEGAGTQSLPVLRIDGEWFRASARDRGFLFRETAERLGIPAAEVPELRDRPR
ncbi:MAG: tRNA epoxyqueuosine(34) reductase QueG, partial [Candidatus Eisenbacteria bacterium]|nr:tRNA epoxyqueuosine(34) reductase QueG [Candidatus Eisenbacteria bacterium]